MNVPYTHHLKQATVNLVIIIGMKILVIGSGGREHALAWKLKQSPLCSHLYIAPGNPGTLKEPAITNIAIATDDITGLVSFAQDNSVDLTIVGPELPLVNGIVDEFNKADLRSFGPTKNAARLEASKYFSKDFLTRHAIPTAAYEVFTEKSSAIAYIKQQGTPIVVKADGLAAGKGVVVAQTQSQAVDAVKNMLSGQAFGEAGQRVVIEEYMTGEEVSFIVMVNGKHIIPLATSQDHKARDNGDLGPNTGGMGAYSPAPVVTSNIYARIMSQIIEPTVTGMAKDGNPYTGFLYAGLMIDSSSNPRVVEYNCRLGDPETQPIMMRLQSDLLELCLAILEGKADTASARWDSRAAVGVVLASKGYPHAYQTGQVISGLENIDTEYAKVFHAGTDKKDGNLVTAGGRVLCATALGETVAKAQKSAYKMVNRINWKDRYYRDDIGYRAIAREQQTQG